MHKSIDRDSPIPLYLQLREILREAIEKGEFSNSEPLPTEEKLMNDYNVSRTTVREAMRGLLELGLIVKKQGIGSFVASEKISEILPGLVSFSEEMEARGFQVRTRVLSCEEIIPPFRVTKAFQIAETERVLKVRRLRYVDNRPIVISTSYLAGGISTDDNFEGSLYKLLGEKYGLYISNGEAIIEACLADEQDAKLLEIPVGSAVLNITWCSKTNSGRVVEFSEATFRGDCYRYVVKLRK